MLAPLLVFLGGGAGAVARWGVGLGWLKLLGAERFWGATLTVNVVGGLFMGLLVGALALRDIAGADRLRLLLATGVLGGFTTFSTFSLETVLMIERRAYGLAFGYALASVVLSVGAVFVGLTVARRLFA